MRVRFTTTMLTDAGEVSASDVSVGSADLAPGMTSTLRPQDSAGGPPSYTNVSYEADTPEGQRRRKKGSEGGEKEGKRRREKAATADPIRDPVMRNMAAQQQQQLRVHIKAQPGTAVHITPSATPPTQASAYHARPQPPGTGPPPTQPGYTGHHRHVPQAARPFSSGGESETEI